MSSRALVTEADEERLERYLRSRAGDSDAYVKSKFIADDIGLTPSQVGLLLKLAPRIGERRRRREVVLHERDHLAGDRRGVTAGRS